MTAMRRRLGGLRVSGGRLHTASRLRSILLNPLGGAFALHPSAQSPARPVGGFDGRDQGGGGLGNSSRRKIKNDASAVWFAVLHDVESGVGYVGAVRPRIVAFLAPEGINSVALRYCLCLGLFCPDTTAFKIAFVKDAVRGDVCCAAVVTSNLGLECPANFHEVI